MEKILIDLCRFYQVVFSRRAHFIFGAAYGCCFERTSSQYFTDPVTISGPLRGSGQGISHIYRYCPSSWQGCDIPPRLEEFVEKHPDAA